MSISSFRFLRPLMLAGVAAVALSACASNRASMGAADYSGLGRSEAHATVAELGQRYSKNPTDKGTIIHYAAALRAVGQAEQAVAVLQQGVDQHPGDPDIRLAYAKALAASGQFAQALNVIDSTIEPEQPDWNALSVKGAILDQMGQHDAARALYKQAMVTAPGQPSLYANLGLSYAMTNDLTQAESQLRKAVGMPGASSQIRQNLALVLGLQGRFEEARTIYSAELPPDQVEANMAYIRALLTQQNRWDVIKGE